MVLCMTCSVISVRIMLHTLIDNSGCLSLHLQWCTVANVQLKQTTNPACFIRYKTNPQNNSTHCIFEFFKMKCDARTAGRATTGHNTQRAKITVSAYLWWAHRAKPCPMDFPQPCFSHLVRLMDFKVKL